MNQKKRLLMIIGLIMFPLEFKQWDVRLIFTHLRCNTINEFCLNVYFVTCSKFDSWMLMKYEYISQRKSYETISYIILKYLRTHEQVLFICITYLIVQYGYRFDLFSNASLFYIFVLFIWRCV